MLNSQELEAIDCMARARLSMRRAAQREASLLTSALSESLVDPRIRMEPELKENIEISKEQNRGFFLAEGVRKLARESNNLSLMLRYQAHAERQYRRAVDEFERLKKLRSEMPNEPISQNPFPVETVQSESVTAQPPARKAPVSSLFRSPLSRPRLAPAVSSAPPASDLRLPAPAIPPPAVPPGPHS